MITHCALCHSANLVSWVSSCQRSCKYHDATSMDSGTDRACPLSSPLPLLDASQLFLHLSLLAFPPSSSPSAFPAASLHICCSPGPAAGAVLAVPSRVGVAVLQPSRQRCYLAPPELHVVPALTHWVILCKRTPGLANLLEMKGSASALWVVKSGCGYWAILSAVLTPAPAQDSPNHWQQHDRPREMTAPKALL